MNLSTFSAGVVGGMIVNLMWLTEPVHLAITALVGLGASIVSIISYHNKL